MALPERVNAMYVVTYNLGEVRSSLAELNGIPEEEVKDHEITDLVNSWISEDFGGQVYDVILQDENGEEVDW